MCGISVVMPCHNRSFDLPRVLSAYECQEGYVPFEIIAVDDGSTDSTFNILSAYHSSRFSLQVRRFPKSRGPAAARNCGIELARYPLLLFVGDDILPTPRFVQDCWEAHQAYPAPEIAILGRVSWPPDIPVNALMKHIDGIGAQQFSYFFLKDRHEYDFRHFYTANISVKRKFLERAQCWFDVSFPYAAFEDAEMAFRLAQKGLRIIYIERLLGYHYHYHTVWSFSRRQYKAGQSAWFFVKKHPSAARRLLRSTHQKSLLLAFLRKRSVQPEVFQRLEEEILCLASFYEWTPCALIDLLFLAVFDYFYFKGISFAAHGNSDLALKALDVYVGLTLKPNLLAFLRRTHSPQESILKEVLELWL